ncbi:hypothetical protein KI387_032827, partial [Taxus chinensis]
GDKEVENKSRAREDSVGGTKDRDGMGSARMHNDRKGDERVGEVVHVAVIEGA